MAAAASGSRLRTQSNSTDPLAAAIAPPADESPEDRAARLAAEEHALHVSQQIDAEIERDRLAAKKAPKAVKLLLLGQSESGKSTTLKNFQLMASPKAFKSERVIWRAVIQLNVVRSIHLILTLLTEAQAAQSSQSPTTSPYFRPTGLPDTSSSPSAPSSPRPQRLTPELLRLKFSLSPLVQVEESLVRRLQISSGQQAAVSIRSNHAGTTAGGGSGGSDPIQRELAVHSASGWKGNFVARMLAGKARAGDDDGDGIDWDDPDDPGRVIHACRDDMMTLWDEPVVRELLEARQIRMQEMSGFFLDSLDRVAGERYVPSDDDILRARIKTLGIAEYRFNLEGGNNMLERQWVVYDVGGHTSLVPKWAAYFDDVNAIIFLAPISCFDQTLEEDERVNRIEDSVNLWRTIVSNRLLAKTNMILFLNKSDILRRKLDSGVQFGKFITSYGARPNTFDATSAYLKRKFQQIFVESSPEKRPFYCNFTSVTDPKATSLLLRDVTEIVLREHLNRSALV